MARQPRLEIEGGLYHIITRGNDRRPIFHSEQDHGKFLSLLAAQKERLPFFLYAFCLMTNHVHLLIERRADMVGRIMHRVLTGYTQYYNRRYNKVGHLLQGRHKSILCQSEVYLGELVRYIHLNPVRAKMVERAEDYPYSSQRAYLGLAPTGIVDLDPVLRLFGSKKERAREDFAQYVAAGREVGYRPDLYSPPKSVLGTEEFVDAAIHRLGDTGYVPKPTDGRLAATRADFDPEALFAAVERVSGMFRADFCGPSKAPKVVAAKEALIVAGRRLGANTTVLAALAGLSVGSVSRRHEAGLRQLSAEPLFDETVSRLVEEYNK